MLLDWDDFAAKAEELVREKPLHTRYTVKYKHSEGKMTLKVTDNEEVSWRTGTRVARRAAARQNLLSLRRRRTLPVLQLRSCVSRQRGRVRSTAAFRVHADSAHSLTLSSAAFCTATAPPQCWTYKTNQASDLKKMEKLNHIMSAVMTRGRSVDLDSLEEPSGEPKRGKR